MLFVGHTVMSNMRFSSQQDKYVLWFNVDEYIGANLRFVMKLCTNGSNGVLVLMS